RDAGLWVHDHRKQVGETRVDLPDFDSQGTLADSREAPLGREDFGGFASQAEATETGRRKHGDVDLSLAAFADAGPHVAADRHDAEVRSKRPKLHAATQRGGAEHGAIRELPERTSIESNNYITRILPYRNAGDREIWMNLGGN